MSKKTKEEIAHEKKRDALIKEKPQEWEHIQKERQKIRQQRTEDALSDADINPTEPTVTFTQPAEGTHCLLYTSPSPRDGLLSRMPYSA